MITLSGFQLAASCPGSASLPHAIREGGAAPTLGHAIHEVIAHVIAGAGPGRDVVRLWSDILDAGDEGRLGFVADHMQLPVPRGALAETPLGYWPDGSVRRVEGVAGQYTDAGQILSGTIDAMWAEPEALGARTPMLGALHFCPLESVLWVVDWKTGAEEHVPPIERNWQLRAGALMAARWTGATRVIPAIVYVNAAECAVAVREGRPYEGRWEVGALLDEAALAKIEADMLRVLRRAEGEDDGPERTSFVGEQQRTARNRESGSEGPYSMVEAGGELGGRETGRSAARLVLGPHCERCPARGACSAFAADALSLARGEGLYLPPGGALTPAAASHLAGLLAPARRALDFVEDAVQAHVRAHGPLLLADGREYGPVLETVRSYRTAETFNALAEVVGDDAANEAFEATGTGLRRALEGQPRGAWGRLKADLEERGAVVETAREIFRRRWPAKTTTDMTLAEPVQTAGKGQDATEMDVAASLPISTSPSPSPGQVETTGEGAADGLQLEALSPTRAECPRCHRTFALTRGGVLRKHSIPGGGLYCA